MTKAGGIKPVAAYLDRDLLLVVNSEGTVKNLNPNQALIKELDGLCVGVTASGKQYDCVSRVFAPKLNVSEDPVTGSTDCMIIPYWARELNKTNITVYQDFIDYDDIL